MSLPESGSSAGDTASNGPAMTVVVGEPSAEELAALVAVLTAVSRPAAGVEDAGDVRVDSWAAPWRGLGAPVPLGPGAWGAGSVG